MLGDAARERIQQNESMAAAAATTASATSTHHIATVVFGHGVDAAVL